MLSVIYVIIPPLVPGEVTVFRYAYPYFLREEGNIAGS